MDSKSIGLCPQGFESPRCRFFPLRTPSKVEFGAMLLFLLRGRRDPVRASAPLQNASAGNGTCITSMATMYSATRPLMLVLNDSALIESPNTDMSHGFTVSMQVEHELVPEAPLPKFTRAPFCRCHSVVEHVESRHESCRNAHASYSISQCARRESNPGHKHGRLV